MIVKSARNTVLSVLVCIDRFKQNSVLIVMPLNPKFRLLFKQTSLIIMIAAFKRHFVCWQNGLKHKINSILFKNTNTLFATILEL